jgi:hypothetical protein
MNGGVPTPFSNVPSMWSDELIIGDFTCRECHHNNANYVGKFKNHYQIKHYLPVSCLHWQQFFLLLVSFLPAFAIAMLGAKFIKLKNTIKSGFLIYTGNAKKKLSKQKVQFITLFFSKQQKA